MSGQGRGGRRDGAGRPAVGERVEIRLPEDALTQIDRYAADHGTTRSAVIRELVTSVTRAKASTANQVYDGVIHSMRSDGLLRGERGRRVETRLREVLDGLHQVCPELRRIRADTHAFAVAKIARELYWVVDEFEQQF